MLFDIYMTFLEDILNKFKKKVRVMVPARCLMLIDIYIKLREDSVNGFQVIEWTRFCDRQTDREMPRGKTICLLTLKGEDIINARIISKAHA